MRLQPPAPVLLGPQPSASQALYPCHLVPLQSWRHQIQILGKARPVSPTAGRQLWNESPGGTPSWAGSRSHQDLCFLFQITFETSSALVQAWRPRVQDELDACWVTHRSYDTRAKYYLLPGNRCCPGLSVLSCLTSLPTCPGPPQRQLFPTPHAAAALSAAWFSGPGSVQLTGAWRMLAVDRLLPVTCACWNQLVLHKLLVQMSGDNKF